VLSVLNIFLLPCFSASLRVLGPSALSFLRFPLRRAFRPRNSIGTIQPICTSVHESAPPTTVFSIEYKAMDNSLKTNTIKTFIFTLMRTLSVQTSCYEQTNKNIPGVWGTPRILSTCDRRVSASRQASPSRLPRYSPSRRSPRGGISRPAVSRHSPSSLRLAEGGATLLRRVLMCSPLATSHTPLAGASPRATMATHHVRAVSLSRNAAAGQTLRGTEGVVQ
jgi:hypothetical protein